MKLRAFVLISRHNQTLACAFVGQALADGDYELVPAQEGEEAEGELNAVRVEPGAEQVASEPVANPASEGKPRSITYVFNYATLYLSLFVHLRFRN